MLYIHLPTIYHIVGLSLAPGAGAGGLWRVAPEGAEGALSGVVGRRGRQDHRGPPWLGGDQHDGSASWSYDIMSYIFYIYCLYVYIT